jgi:NAD(P)H dehydrogenase (quinone)
MQPVAKRDRLQSRLGLASAFTASQTAHGGQEATLLALNHVFCHWGGITVPPGDVTLGAAGHQARRAVDVAAALTIGRAA